MTVGVQNPVIGSGASGRPCPQFALRGGLINVGRQEGFELSTKGLQIPRSTN